MDVKQLSGDELYASQKTKVDRTGPAVLMDNVEDPRNVGSIFRLAEAFGCRHVFYRGSMPNRKLSKVMTTSRGCDDYLSISQNPSLDGLQLVAIELTNQSTSLFDYQFSLDCTLVVGNEEHGITNEVLRVCSEFVSIPLFGIKGSINVATALAIVLYEWRRQHA